MRQLYVTDIEKPTIFKPHLGEGTRIALKSISIRGTWLNVFDVMNLRIFKQEATAILKVHIKIEKGLYRVEDLAAIINSQAGDKLKVSILRNGMSRISVSMGYKAIMDRKLGDIFGLDNDIALVLPAGDYDGSYRTDVYQRLRLKCTQIDRELSLFNGEKSDILALLPTKELNDWGKMLTWSFDSPVYLPLKGSTDRLEFMLADEYHDRNILFTGLTMHLLIE